MRTSDPPSSRTPFLFPSRQTVDDDIAMEYLGTLVVYFALYGFLFLVVGVVAIVLPIVFSSISVQQMVAWMLIVGGLVSLLHFFLVLGSPGTTSFVLLGALHLACGIWLLVQARMRRGIAFVWLMLGWFIIHGLLKLVMGYDVRSLKSWPAMVASGASAIILGILVMALTPAYGFVVLGIMFGVDLVVTGLAFLLISLAAYQESGSISTRRDPLIEH